MSKKQIAQQRVEILLKKAEDQFIKNPSLSKRYVTLAKKIAMRARYRLPQEVKRSVCKGCNLLQKPGVSCTVRQVSDKKEIIHTCNQCGQIKRYRY